MFVSSIDNKSVEIVNEVVANADITSLTINGPHIKIEGYASIDGVITYAEHRIRKMLLIVPKLDIEKLRNDFEEYEELSEGDIIEQYTLMIPLENCRKSELDIKGENYPDDDMSSLDGYKGNIDLSIINNGKPLKSGEYSVFIKLEQLSSDNDNLKYEKILPISNFEKLMKSNTFATKLEHFSGNRVLKYNLIMSFDNFTKTLRFKNTLLQSFNPKDLPENNEKREGRYLQAIKRKFFKLFYIFFCILPINQNKIVFASDSRSELNGNLYFVYEELYKRKLDLKINFLLNERIDQKKTFIGLVKTAFQFATSKIIIIDDFYPMIYPLKIRKRADLIQVWHAAGAFKTFGFSRMGRPGGPSPRSINHKNYTKAVVSSDGVRDNYAEGFGITIDKVYPAGIPRSDIFFDENYKKYVKKTLYSKYPYLKDKKVILFAPTFRGNGQASAHYPFESLNFKELYNELHQEYIFLFKNHPFVNNKLNIPYEYAEFFYDFSDYREINDLLLVTDILITDYSSVCFEFALLNKPMLFYAFDVEKYIEERDFYYNFFEFIPGPLLRTTKEIIATIKEEEFELEKIKPFVKYFFDDTLGKASRNVVDQLIIPSLEDVDVEKKEKPSMLPPPASRIELFERSIYNNTEEN